MTDIVKGVQRESLPREEFERIVSNVGERFGFNAEVNHISGGIHLEMLENNDNFNLMHEAQRCFDMLEIELRAKREESLCKL